MLIATHTWTSQVRLEEKIEMVENFLKAGVTWDVVINATGITPEKLQELKATLQEMMAGKAK